MSNPTSSTPDPPLPGGDVEPDGAVPTAEPDPVATPAPEQPADDPVADDPVAVDQAAAPSHGASSPARPDRLQQVFTWIVLLLIVAAIVILIVSIRRHDANSGAPASAFEQVVHGPIAQSISSLGR